MTGINESWYADRLQVDAPAFAIDERNEWLSAREEYIEENSSSAGTEVRKPPAVASLVDTRHHKKPIIIPSSSGLLAFRYQLSKSRVSMRLSLSRSLCLLSSVFRSFTPCVVCSLGKVPDHARQATALLCLLWWSFS